MFELLYMSCSSMPTPFPTVGIVYFGVKRAIMCSETSLQNHLDLDQSKTYTHRIGGNLQLLRESTNADRKRLK